MRIRSYISVSHYSTKPFEGLRKEDFSEWFRLTDGEGSFRVIPVTEFNFGFSFEIGLQADDVKVL